MSLVPSVTETLVALGVEPVACTRFCDRPGIPTVGGTKDPDVGAIVSLAPDLVVVCDEENRFADAAALMGAGLSVHSTSPRSVDDVGPEVAALAAAVGAPVPSPFAAAEWAEWLQERRSVRRERGSSGGRDAFVAVWRRPWMTLSSGAYGSSVLDLLGIGNVFAGEPERYPEVSLDEVRARCPDLVVLPDEPYPFSERHAAEVRDALGVGDVRLVDGRDLFWFGVRTPEAVGRLDRVFAQ